MKRGFKTAIVGVAIALAPAFASAMPLSGIIEEGGPSGDYNGLVADHTFGDFNNSTSAPVVTIGGDFTLYGSVKHSGPSTYMDGWTMDFTGGTYDLDFAWQNQLSTPLDFAMTIASAGGTSSTGFTLGTGFFFGSGTAGLNGLGELTGLWRFLINPITGQNSPVEIMNWQLSGTFTPTAVPLPAGALFLLAGVGGLGALRRLKRTD